MPDALAAQDSLSDLCKKHMLSPFTSLAEQEAKGPHIIVRGEGARVWNEQGYEMLDGMAGIWCVNVGYGRESIVEAMARQARTLPYYHSFRGMANEPAIRLAARVAGMVPLDHPRVFFGNSGSDANDTQVKLIWHYNNLRGKPEKKKIIARDGGYHGVTLATASVSGLPVLREGFDLPLPGFVHVEKPHHFWNAPEGMSEEAYAARLARQLDERIVQEGPDTVAAFIAEPVMGAGGVIVPPKGYFEAIRPVLDKHDVLLIADEVVCGFGRLGTWFGSEYFNFRPDLMTLAKGLTSGYLPMSAAVVSERVWRVVHEASARSGPFNHGYTYTAHPVSAAAALANLDILEGEDLPGRARETGAYLQGQLRARFSGHPLVAEVRGIGMIAGVELALDKAAKKPFPASANIGGRWLDHVFAEGLVGRGIVNTMAFSPPLTLSLSEVDELCDKLERALARLEKELHAEGLLAGA